MATITLRQLRDTRQFKALLQAGEVIDVCERYKFLGSFQPRSSRTAATSYPDFVARMKETFGDRQFDVVGDLIADREDRF